MTRFLFTMAWRETRAAWRHFLYFLVCIAVGVGALVGVSLFGTNVELAIKKEARGLLGGDLEIRLSHALSPDGQALLVSLASRGIATTRISELVAMASKEDLSPTVGQGTQIIEIKAVESEYPFYGKIKLDSDGNLHDLLSPHNHLCPEEICFGAVVHESLLIRMGLAMGDRLKIGQANFVIRGIVRTEPDRMANAFSLGPRVFVSQEGLRSADLVKPGSRVRERYLLKIPSTLALEPLLYELRGRLSEESARVSDYRENQPQLKQFLEQLTRYLGLVGLTALLVGGLGVATSVHAFVREKLHTIAVLKTLGADSATVIWTYVVQALMLGSCGSLVGLVIGVLLQRGLPWMFAALLESDLLRQLGFSTDLSIASLIPLGKGLALGLLSTLLFVLWPLLTIRDIKPAMILRREVVVSGSVTGPSWWSRWRGIDRVKGLASVGIGLGLVLLSIWQAGSLKLGLLFIGGFAVAVLALGGTASAVLFLLRKWPKPTSFSLRQAVGNLVRPGSQAVSVTIAIGIGVMVVVTVSLVERALLSQVGDSRPTNAPTFFFIDIQPDQADSFTRLLRDGPGNLVPELTPLVRSRLSALKGERIVLDAMSEADERSGNHLEREERRRRWYLGREYVLTYLQDLPKDNEIVSGRWWRPGEISPNPLVSIEEDAARHLGLSVGDPVELDIQGAKVTGEVSSIRRVEWGNFSTNFYMIFSPGALDGAPVTYVATVHVPQSEEIAVQEAVVRAFPNVTAINIGDVLETFSNVLDRLSLAIRAVALFCIVSGGLVLAAALAATRYRRLYESVVLKSLGATRGIIARSFALEYAILGAVGGLLGCCMASALSWGILSTLFDLTWSLQPTVLALGLFITVVLSLSVGFLSTYRILGQPPLPVLRHE